MTRVSSETIHAAASKMLRSRLGVRRLPDDAIRVQADRIGWLVHLRERDEERVAEIYLDEVHRAVVAVQADGEDEAAASVAKALQWTLWNPRRRAQSPSTGAAAASSSPARRIARRQSSASSVG